MASSKEEQTQKAKQPAAAQGEKSKNNANNSTSTKNKYLMPVIALIMALIALCIAIYTLFLNNQLNNQLTNANTNFSTLLKQQEEKQNHTQAQINKKTQDTEEAQTKLQTGFKNLRKQLENAMNQRFYQNQDWLLLKARYYLDLAQINAHWSNNLDSTIALLQEADQLLKQFNEPKIFDVRQAIAKDIARLQAMPLVDISGLLSQLDAAQDRINNLSIPLPLSLNKPLTENTAISTSKPSSWRSHAQESLNFLEKLIVIRRHEQNIKPLMSPMFEAILKENLLLNLQEAQWAILNNNPFVYQLVLKQAIENLKMHFNENSPNTAALVKELTDLQQIKLSVKKPTIDSALPLLNKLIHSQKKPVNHFINPEAGGDQ